MILKICGITNQVDASAAIEAGANAIGFNFYPRSPRYLTPEQAAGIVTADGVRRVGVFVNESPARLEEILREARLDVAQLHGDETDVKVAGHRKVWKAVRVSDDFEIAAYDDLPVEALLLDGPAGAEYGGQGRVFDWRLVRATKQKIVLAGGLNAANVALAVERVHPWGVDACSGVESAPGKKDHKKMREFLIAAKAALS